jgi:myo-inositol-1(or 4)-monophosphatase
MAGDLVTIADIESEKAILLILKKGFPDYNIRSEEEGETNKKSDYTLVIDPLDGTNNFLLNMPIFSVSITLLYKKKAVLGVVYQPIINQTYTAIKGKGASLNGKKISVNNITDPKRLTIIYTCGYKINRLYLGKLIGSLFAGPHKRVINNWSAAFEHCLLACGKTECMINDGTELHDYAAGKLIALEAGAKVINFKGEKETDYTNDKYILSNTDEVNEYVLSIIKPLQKFDK